MSATFKYHAKKLAVCAGIGTGLITTAILMERWLNIPEEASYCVVIGVLMGLVYDYRNGKIK